MSNKTTTLKLLINRIGKIFNKNLQIDLRLKSLELCNQGKLLFKIQKSANLFHIVSQLNKIINTQLISQV